MDYVQSVCFGDWHEGVAGIGCGNNNIDRLKSDSVHGQQVWSCWPPPVGECVVHLKACGLLLSLHLVGFFSCFCFRKKGCSSVQVNVCCKS